MRTTDGAKMLKLFRFSHEENMSLSGNRFLAKRIVSQVRAHGPSTENPEEREQCISTKGAVFRFRDERRSRYWKLPLSSAARSPWSSATAIRLIANDECESSSLGHPLRSRLRSRTVRKQEWNWLFCLNSVTGRELLRSFLATYLLFFWCDTKYIVRLFITIHSYRVNR